LKRDRGKQATTEDQPADSVLSSSLMQAKGLHPQPITGAAGLT
jgi:hypothetical protein